jgi:serine/threonine-protein phosphatase 2A regulatory subunit B''
LTEFPDYSEWDRFAKTEYERLAMEEEQGEDSEVLDAMDGWDSEEENQSSGGAANNNTGTSPAADSGGDKK